MRHKKPMAGAALIVGGLLSAGLLSSCAAQAGETTAASGRPDTEQSAVEPDTEQSAV